MLELLTMKSQWRRDMERMLAERAAKEKSEDSDSSLDECESSSTTNPHYVEICI